MTTKPTEPVTPTEGEREPSPFPKSTPVEAAARKVIHAADGWPQHHKAAVNELIAATRAEAMEEAAQVAEAEEELPGKPLPAVIGAAKADPIGTLRAAVRLTKRNIAAAIRAKGGR